MNNYKTLGQQISEQMLAITNQLKPFQSPLADFAKAFQNQYKDFLPLSVKLTEAMKQNIDAIKAINFGNDFSRTILPTQSLLNEIARQQKLVGQFAIPNIPTINIPIDKQLLESIKRNSFATAFQSFKLNQLSELQSSSRLIERINEISAEIKARQRIEDEKFQIITETLDRIEQSLTAIQANSHNSNTQLIPVDKIYFYIELIFGLLLFLISYVDQQKTDLKIDEVGNEVSHFKSGQENISDQLDLINERLDSIADQLAMQNKRVCMRDTYVRLKPSFNSYVITKIYQFETVVIDDLELSTSHKWIKVKYIDIKENKIRTGWVLKKYFRAI